MNPLKTNNRNHQRQCSRRPCSGIGINFWLGNCTKNSVRNFNENMESFFKVNGDGGGSWLCPGACVVRRIKYLGKFCNYLSGHLLVFPHFWGMQPLAIAGSIRCIFTTGYFVSRSPASGTRACWAVLPGGITGTWCVLVVRNQMIFVFDFEIEMPPERSRMWACWVQVRMKAGGREPIFLDFIIPFMMIRLNTWNKGKYVHKLVYGCQSKFIYFFEFTTLQTVFTSWKLPLGLLISSEV